LGKAGWDRHHMVLLDAFRNAKSGEIARNHPYRLHRDVAQLLGVVAPRPGVFT